MSAVPPVESRPPAWLAADRSERASVLGPPRLGGQPVSTTPNPAALQPRRERRRAALEASSRSGTAVTGTRRRAGTHNRPGGATGASGGGATLVPAATAQTRSHGRQSGLVAGWR